MITAYFDVKPRKAASVPVRQAVPEVFKPTSSPQAVTPGLVMHAQFKPLRGDGSPVVGSFGSIDEDESTLGEALGEALGEVYETGEDDDLDPDDDDVFPETEELESLTDATTAQLDEIDLDADEPGDPAVDAHFFGSIRRKRADKAADVIGIVFSGPMLCCEDEDFD